MTIYNATNAYLRDAFGDSATAVSNGNVLYAPPGAGDVGYSGVVGDIGINPTPNVSVGDVYQSALSTSYSISSTKSYIGEWKPMVTPAGGNNGSNGSSGTENAGASNTDTGSVAASTTNGANTTSQYAKNNKATNAGKLSSCSNLQDQTGKAECCNPAVVDTLVKLANEASKYGCRIVITSSFRTQSDQKRLLGTRGSFGHGGYAAAAGSSPHEFGQAIDFQIWKGNTKLSISRTTTPWAITCLTQNGMQWGGDYSTTKEPWHFNTNNARSLRAQLQQDTISNFA